MAVRRNLSADTVAHRRAFVAKRRLQGYRLQEIAHELNTSEETIQTDLKALAEMWRAEAVIDVELERTQDLQRIDQMLVICWKAIDKSKEEAALWAVDRVDRLLQRRGAIIGYDAPKRTENANTTALSGKLAVSQRRVADRLDRLSDEQLEILEMLAADADLADNPAANQAFDADPS